MIKPKCKPLKGGHNPVCVLNIKFPKEVLGINLSPGKYVLKNIKKENISSKDIRLLKELSDLKLIPRIYYIDSKELLMDYFEGETLTSYFKNNKLSKELYSKIRKLILKWHRLGFAHGDLGLVFNKQNKLVGDGNLLIGKNNEIILIDPTIGKIYDSDIRISQFNIKRKMDLEFLRVLKFYIDRSVSEVFKL